jgi:hypothetical protein
MKRKTFKKIWKVLVALVAFATVFFLIAPFASYF